MTSYLAYCDAAEAWQISIQDPATPAAEGIFFFHNYLMFFLIVIGVFVFWLLYSAFKSSQKKYSNFSHSSILEIIWTIIPAFILLILAIPSFTLLYSLDELSNPVITVKIIGHQWYWSYEITDLDVNSQQNINLHLDCS